MDHKQAFNFLHQIGFTPNSRQNDFFIIGMSELHITNEEVQLARDSAHLKAIILQKLNDVCIEMAKAFVKARMELESGAPLTRTWGIIN